MYRLYRGQRREVYGGFAKNARAMVSKTKSITGYSKKVSAELFICYLLVLIVVLFRHGA